MYIYSVVGMGGAGQESGVAMGGKLFAHAGKRHSYSRRGVTRLIRPAYGLSFWEPLD